MLTSAGHRWHETNRGDTAALYRERGWRARSPVRHGPAVSYLPDCVAGGWIQDRQRRRFCSDEDCANVAGSVTRVGAATLPTVFGADGMVTPGPVMAIGG